MKIVEKYLNLFELEINFIMLITTSLLTVFILFFFNKNLIEFNLTDPNSYYLQCYYLANKFIALLEHENYKKYKKFEMEFSDKIDIHKISSICQREKNSKCFICNNLPNDYSKAEIKSSIKKFFLNMIMEEKNSRSDFYYNLLRIRSLWICFYAYKSHENLLLLELYKNKSKCKNFHDTLLYGYLYTEFFNLKSKENSKINTSNFQTIVMYNIDNILNYYDVCREFEKIIKNVKESFIMLSGKIIFSKMISISKSIYKSQIMIKKNIKKITENFNLYMIYFHFKLIFNEDLNKNYRLEDNLESLNVIEENYDKLNYFFLEYLPKELNFKIKTVTLDLLKEMKCEKSFIKNEFISKIFPSFMVEFQLEKLLKNFQHENKDMFVVELLLRDKENNLKCFIFNIKAIIDKSLRIFFVVKYKNISKKVTSSKNLLLLVSNRGEMIGASEQFKNYFNLVDKNEESKFNDFVKTPFQKLFDLENTEDKKYQQKKNKKINCKKSIKFLISQIFKQEFLKIKNDPMSSLGTRAGGTTCEDQINYNELVKVYLEEVINFDFKKLYLFNFKRYNSGKNKNKNSYVKKDCFFDEIKSNEDFNNDNLPVPTESQYTDMSAFTIRNSSTTESIRYDDALKQSYPAVIQNNMNIYNKLQKSESNRKHEFLIYFLNFFLSIVGIFFILYLNVMLSKYNKNFLGLFRFRHLRTQIAVETVKSTLEIKLNGSNIKFKDGSVLNEEKIREDISICQTEVIGNDLIGLKAFINDDSKDELSLKINQKINYVDPSITQNDLIIKTKTFVELLDYIYVLYLNIKQDANIYFESTMLNNFDNLSSKLIHYVFLIQNYFPVYERVFREIDSVLKNSILLSIQEVRTNVIVYQIFFIIAHLSVLVLVVLLLKKYYNKFKLALNLISEFDEAHLNNLKIKYNMLEKSIEYLITPSKLIKTVQNNNPKPENGYRKKETKVENTLQPLNKQLENQINEVWYDSHSYPVWGVFITYCLLFTISIFLYNLIINDIDHTTVFVNELAEIQFQFFSSFILFRLGTISGLNLTTVLKSDLEFYTAEEYLLFTQNVTVDMLDSYKKIYNLNYSTEIKFYADRFTNMSGSSICSYALDKSDSLFLVQADSLGLYNKVYSRCIEDLKNEGHIFYEFFPKINRHLIYQIDSLISNNTLENRLAIVNNEFSMNYSEIFVLYIGQYFNKLYSTMIEPLVTNSFQTFFSQFILMFTVSIIVDVVCGLLIKFLILNRVGYVSKKFLILFNIYKN
jgi:hypothetical protein